MATITVRIPDRSKKEMEKIDIKRAPSNSYENSKEESHLPL